MSTETPTTSFPCDTCDAQPLVETLAPKNQKTISEMMQDEYTKLGSLIGNACDSQDHVDAQTVLQDAWETETSKETPDLAVIQSLRNELLDLGIIIVSKITRNPDTGTVTGQFDYQTLGAYKTTVLSRTTDPVALDKLTHLSDDVWIAGLQNPSLRDETYSIIMQENRKQIDCKTKK